MADREQVSIPLHMLTRTCIGFGILVAALVGVIVFLVYYQDCKGCQQELNECRVQLSRESMSCKYEKGGHTSCETELQKCKRQIEQEYFDYSELISYKATRPYLFAIIVTLLSAIVGYCVMSYCWSRNRQLILVQKGPRSLE